MKKTITIISLLGIVALASACSDDNSSKRYCDSGFVGKCEGGVYLRCEGGEVTEYDVYKIGSLDYVCNDKNVLVVKDLKCESGKIVKSDGTKVDHLCEASGDIVFCSGDTVAIQKAYCGNNSTHYCRLYEGKIEGATEYRVETESCKSGVCEEYSRGSVIVAGCFNKESVSEGCVGSTAEGSCSADHMLTFCTSSDKSKGKTLRLDCKSANPDGVCLYIGEGWGYDCTSQCGEGKNRPSFHGSCDGNTVSYCVSEDEGKTYTPAEDNCESEGKVCGMDWTNPVNPVYGCIDKAK